jgi:N-acetylglucosamine-6-phosphate deacetylase
LTADDLQHLKAILDQEDLKKITMPKAPELPSDTQVLKEAERLDVEVYRGTTAQQFTFMKERVKTGTTITGNASGSMSGMDIFLDNGEPYKKAVEPLVKWFDETGKKNKLQESKPQYCR